MIIFNMVISILMHLAVLSQIEALQVTCLTLKSCDIINVVKIFLTVFHRIYCPKFLTLSNQMSHYKSKCITMMTDGQMDGWREEDIVLSVQTYVVTH